MLKRKDKKMKDYKLVCIINGKQLGAIIQIKETYSIEEFEKDILIDQPFEYQITEL